MGTAPAARRESPPRLQPSVIHGGRVGSDGGALEGTQEGAGCELQRFGPLAALQPAQGRWRPCSCGDVARRRREAGAHPQGLGRGRPSAWCSGLGGGLLIAQSTSPDSECCFIRRKREDVLGTKARVGMQGLGRRGVRTVSVFKVRLQTGAFCDSKAKVCSEFSGQSSEWNIFSVSLVRDVLSKLIAVGFFFTLFLWVTVTRRVASLFIV